MKHYIKYFLILGVFMGMSACVDNFYVKDIYTVKNYLFVDGTITNLNEPQYIYINRTNPAVTYNSSNFTSQISPPKDSYIPYQNASVTVTVNGSERVVFKETEPGVYASPEGFVGKVGSSYKLSIVGAGGGARYESSAETMLPVPPIKKVDDIFNERGVKLFSIYGEQTPTNDVVVDFDDPASQQNFYRWRTVTYESLSICETCTQSKYYLVENNGSIDGQCLKDLTLPPNAKYDYLCERICWEMIPSTTIVIFADNLTNGKEQKQKRVAQVPLHQSNGALVSVQQMSLTTAAYRYYKLLEDQSVSIGSLADTPPAPVRSNITNSSNADELILGFFSASAVDDYRHWMSRTNTKGGERNGFFRYVNFRRPETEAISPPDRLKIPLAICKGSRTRTPIAPSGWRF
jgi:hypothetical protein